MKMILSGVRAILHSSSDDTRTRTPSGLADNLPTGISEYVFYQATYRGQPQDFYALADYRAPILRDLLAEVVRTEGPNPYHCGDSPDCQLLCMAKAGQNLVAHTLRAARQAVSAGLISIRGDFLWPADMQEPPVRRRPDGNVEDISLEEIAEAAIISLRNAVGMSGPDLVSQTARLFGFNRTGSKVSRRIEAGIDLALANKRIAVREGTYLLPRK